MAAKKDESAAGKARGEHEKDQAQMRKRNAARGVAHQAAEVHCDVVSGETSERCGELHAFGGRVYLEVDGVFSQDDWSVFQRQAAAAFQAVS